MRNEIQQPSPEQSQLKRARILQIDISHLATQLDDTLALEEPLFKPSRPDPLSQDILRPRTDSFSSIGGGSTSPGQARPGLQVEPVTPNFAGPKRIIVPEVKRTPLVSQRVVPSYGVLAQQSAQPQTTDNLAQQILQLLAGAGCSTGGSTIAAQPAQPSSRFLVPMLPGQQRDRGVSQDSSHLHSCSAPK